MTSLSLATCVSSIRESPRNSRRTRSADGVDDLLLRERAGLVLVDHVKDGARHRQELGAELLVGRGGRAHAPLLLGLELLDALGQAAVDRLLPCA